MSTPDGALHGPVAVTGVGGRTGSRVARLLLERGVDTLLLTRDPERLRARWPGSALPNGSSIRGPAAYAGEAAMARAMDGARSLVLVSGALSGHRVADHRSVLRAAASVGVEHVVYTSLLSAAPNGTYRNVRDHWHTEQAIAAGPMDWTVLRCSFWASTLPILTIEPGVVRGPAGDGLASLVSHEDVAEVAVAVVTAPTDEHGRRPHRGKILDVTGPEAISLTEATSRASAVIGTPLTFESQTAALAYHERVALPGPPSEEQVLSWVSWYLAIAAGELSTVSDVVPRLTGHPARTLEQTLREQPADRRR